MSLSAIGEAIKNRLSSPILGNYILSLLLLNWRVPTYLLTGEISPTERIALVESYMATYWYKWSFVTALGISLLYLYALPLIEVGIKRVQMKVSVFVFKKNNELDAMYENENKYGADFDLLASGLKVQLGTTNKILDEICVLLDGGQFQPASGNKLDLLTSKRREATKLTKDNYEHINALSGIFDKTLNSKPLEAAQNAKSHRDNKVKAKR